MRIVTREQVLPELYTYGIPTDAAIHFGDNDGVILTPEDVTIKLATEYTSVLNQMGYTWVPGIRDCDDHARGAAFWAGYWNSRNPGVKSAPWFGEVWCGLMAHAFNIAIHAHDDGDLYVACYEPQIGKNGFSFNEIMLTPEQTESIYMVRF
jgi:hypothetical protein